jgi:hypothetical protein
MVYPVCSVCPVCPVRKKKGVCTPLRLREGERLNVISV